ncbi:MAG: 1,4-alpha-glucan branching protein GlgB [Candidatus Contendobacter sp.]|nr:1,4-alpha-glucan branching protein GlgB [Candidatus Contendobacter sp.]
MDRIMADAALLHMGLHPDPFAVLGRHGRGDRSIIRVFLPGARQVRLLDIDQPLRRLADTDLFEWRGVTNALPPHYRLAWTDAVGRDQVAHDPYNFLPQLSLYDLHLFNEGRHLHAYRVLGAHPRMVDHVAGVLFAVWAPNAAQVSVVGDFNQWDGLRHPLRRRGGVWELFVPDVAAGARYQFELRVRETGERLRKGDPYGRWFERRPANFALVMESTPYPWRDEMWMTQRRRSWAHAPLAVYEVHLGSWQRDEQGDYLNYRDMARRLVAYAGSLGFTHIELMPVTEHPLDASWGYQPTGYFAPTSRHGSPHDFHWFVDYCHQAGIGVILDWVPGHFPKDAHGLAQFDGTYLYEHQDPGRREQRGWGTLAFDYGRNQVKNFLLASACFWLEEYHLDGLRVDAVASMLYLDYARESGEWAPNLFGGNENLEAVAFLRELNEIIHRRYPGVLMIAEESTAWPLVTRPSWMGGLGFSMKWNMGWMHDILEYLSSDPALRCHHHELLTFGLLYAFTENFMLPLSHDEVVHGKGSLLSRMPGDRHQRFANLRLLYLYMWTYPGKKFLFMGNELAQEREWDHAAVLDWESLNWPECRGIQGLVRDLNHFYLSMASLYDSEFSQEGFEWLDCHDAARSVVAYLRRGGGDDPVLVVMNFAAVARLGYRVGVPLSGFYQEILNSDAEIYGGGGMSNGVVHADSISHLGYPCSLVLDLPPLTGLILVSRRGYCPS